MSSGVGQFGAIQPAAPSLGVEVSPINVRDDGEIERDLSAFAASPNGGLILTASAAAAIHRDFTVAAAARYKLPAVYYDRNFAAAGGLISYGPDLVDQYRPRPATSIASSKARSRPSCPCRRRPSTCW